MTNGLDFLAQTIISGNLVFIQGLGLYALTRRTTNVKAAVQAGLNTFLAMVVGALLLWALGGLIPSSLPIQVGFYLIIGLVAAVVVPELAGFELDLEQRLADSALVGLLLLMARDGISGVNNVWIALGSGLGYLLALVVMAMVRQRLELAPVPKALRGTPILLIATGLFALALLGFRF